ncbi:thiamine pyrophosphate-binding protein [Mediterraneibacter agrestimuris]|uniref:thiamine pyrophosphate-binding protein n=1 Tax=Mediterraneibacter agrestimuris TaxID=2941333 RepID=UPI00203A64DF|nr:thiamine pyrophosphate-binding protein [Mediterraneibacter agrestimuris]
MKVSDYIVEFLIEKEISDVFGYPGGMAAHLIDSFDKYKEDITIHTNYHEQASAFAANGYAQVTGKVGVAYSSSGPGATNLITGICNAFFDSIPTLFLTGQVNTYEAKKDLPIRQKGFQETEILPIVKSVTKYCAYIEHESDIRYELEKAFYFAQEGRKGPVLLDIPMNIQRMDIDPENLRSFQLEQQQKSQIDISVITQSIKNSKRPVLLVGAGTKPENTKKLVRQLVEKWRIPLVSSMLAVDVVSSDEEMNFGFIGAYGNRAANFIIAKSDLVIAIGSRLDVRQVGGQRENFAPDAQLIRVDIDEGELFNRVNNREKHICADAQEILQKILAEPIDIGESLHQWRQICNKIRKKLYGIDDKTPNIITNKIGKAIPDGYTITTDVGQNQVWVAQSFYIKQNQNVFFSGGLGSMGYSLPAAIGAYYGSKKPVVSFNGDGGLQMNIQELQFITREKLPIAIVVLNNRALGMIRHFQEMYFDGCYSQTVNGNGYESPDFKKIAQAYGIKYCLISEEKEIKEDSFIITEPILIEVVFNENTYVFPKLEFGKPNQDQEPLLDRQLYEELMIL